MNKGFGLAPIKEEGTMQVRGGKLPPIDGNVAVYVGDKRYTPTEYAKLRIESQPFF